MIDLTLQRGVLSAQSKKSLLARLSEIVLKWEGLAGNEKAKRFAFAYAHEVAPEDFMIGGNAVELSVYRIQVTVPEGALRDEDKPGLIREATAALLKAEGAADSAENRARVWCIITHVPEGNWGGGGKVFPYMALRRRLAKAGQRTVPGVE